MSGATLRGTGLTALLLAGFLALFGHFHASAASEPLPSSEAPEVFEPGDGRPQPVVRIPGDYPLPGPGEQVVVVVPKGADILLADDSFDSANWTASVKDVDLLLEQATGRQLLFEGFFAEATQPATLTFAGLPPLLAVDLRELVVAGLPLIELIIAILSETAPAAGPAAAAGGGELFGIVPIISWLLDRLDFISETQAAEPESAAALADMPLLEQLLAQFRIAREAEILKAAMAYEAVTAAILETTQRRAQSGRAGRADTEQARAVHLEAQLEVKEAEYRHLLAIDAHQDDFGDRLLKAAYPTWQDEPPRGLDAIRAAVAPEQHKVARRYARQRDFADETKKLLETLAIVAGDVRNAYMRQFEIGRRTILDVLGAERTVFRTGVQLAQRDFELKSAEAWLLAAMGKLSADYIRRPGWQ